MHRVVCKANAALVSPAFHTLTAQPDVEFGMLPQLPGLEVWFQRASDVVRKLLYGDVDLGIVGADLGSG